MVDQLGQGTFGQVFLCHQIGGANNDSSAGDAAAAPVAVAVKVVKNKPAYMSQAWVEVRVARLLNGRGTCNCWREREGARASDRDIWVDLRKKNHYKWLIS